MKVLIAGTSFGPSYGGPAVSVARLAEELAKDGVEVGLWAPDGTAMTASIPVQSTVVCIDGGIEEALARFGVPDMIHDNGIWLRHNHLIAIAAERRGIRRVVSPRGMLEPWARKHKAWKKWLAWLGYQRSDLKSAACLHAATDAEAHNIAALNLGPRVVVIPNGVDIPAARERPASRADGQKVALFLGRIYPVKGLPLLVEAWSVVRPPGWILRIAGPDEAGHRGEIGRQIREAGLSEIISFTGPVAGPEKQRTFSEANLFVLPTHSESFGMAIAEALANGLPVLTTTAAPWPDLARAGCGWRVDPTVDALAGGISAATKLQPDVLEEMGRRGRNLAEDAYRWRSVAERMMSVYVQVLSQ